MSQDEILTKIGAMESSIISMILKASPRLDRTAMCERLQITGKTLKSRLGKGLVPQPDADGRWSRLKLVEWETGKPFVWPLPATEPAPSFVVRERGSHLYRHFDEAGNLLYVGISLSAINRMADHRDNSAWYWSVAKVTIEVFPTRQEAEAAERNAIRAEKPLFNRMHGDKARCDMARKML